jgi:transcriptional regulator with XRE-family HTH domain
LKLDEDRVRGKRERLGLTVAMLAQKAGTSKNTVLSAEHGRDIRPTTARKIAEALDVEIDDLLGEPESPLAEALPSAQLTFNGVLAEEWGYRPNAKDIEALDGYLSKVEQRMDEGKMRRAEVEHELEVLRAFGPAVYAVVGDEIANRILDLGHYLLDEAEALQVREIAEDAAGVVTRLDEVRAQRAS